jgi:KaiC/GvpD/RAD55 family RecA-like ATPase
MKNLTLAISEQVLNNVRKYAANRGTTVNAIVRDHLTRIAAEADKAARARERLVELSRTSTAEVGAINWKRDDLYGR